MDRRVIYSLGGLLAIGVALGWVMSDVEVPQVADNDTWQAFETSLSKTQSMQAEVEIIKSSGIIREFLTAAQKQAAEEVKEADGGDVPPLPKIISTAIIDGEPRLHIKQGEGRPISLVAGELLENGWTVKTVNLNTVVFKYEDLERSITLINYDLSSEHPNGEADDKTQSE